MQGPFLFDRVKKTSVGGCRAVPCPRCVRKYSSYRTPSALNDAAMPAVLGALQYERGKLAAAQASLTRAIYAATLGEGHTYTVRARRSLAAIDGKRISGGTKMIDQIVAAMLGGIAASAGKVASQAVEEAYGALKKLLTRKLGENSEAVEAVAKLEAKPDSEGRKATVAEELAAAKVADDPELAAAAQRLKIALDQLPADGRAHIQHAVGNYIAQASGGSTAAVNVGRQDSTPET